MGVLVAIIVLAASAQPAIALTVSVNAPLNPAFGALDDMMAGLANRASQIIALIETVH